MLRRILTDCFHGIHIDLHENSQFNKQKPRYVLSCLCGMVHIKDPLLLIEKSSWWSGSNRFPLIISVILNYILSHITTNKNVLSVSLNKTFPSFLSRPASAPRLV